mgnify:CR=1 FL=1
MKILAKHIAQTIKALRQELGWSLDKTAKATGVSKAMLGQIEREESSPTIATLWKIAKGFQQPFSRFITKPSAKTEILHPTDHQIRVQTLFPFDPLLQFEMFVIELLPGCEHLSPAHAEGVTEHIIAIEGSLEILIQGNWQLLKPGEGLHFAAHEAHGYRNLSKKIIRFHNIIHYPSLGSD